MKLLPNQLLQLTASTPVAKQKYREAVSLGSLSVEPLLNVLGDDDPWIRRKAAEALVKIGKPAVEPLITVIKDKDWHVRGKAAYTLQAR